MKKNFVILLIAISVYACKKDRTQNTVCHGCNIRGTYTGAINQVAACYACIPYLDTTFTGIFFVDTLSIDSIKIIRQNDNYQWEFIYNDTGTYSRSACCTVGESFSFKPSDSLIYYYNNGGSGGYYREEFNGKK